MISPYRTAAPQGPLDEDLICLLEGVETATIGHFEISGFLSSDLRPLSPARVVGRAITVNAPGPDGRIIYMAIDTLVPGDILVIARPNADNLACVGGGVTAAARAKGAVAIIVDGPCTDPEEIVSNGLPVWCRGVSARTTTRHVQIGGELNHPVACGGAVVMPGYCMLADQSGIYVAAPARMREVAARARARQSRSALVRKHIAAGRSIFAFDQENPQ